MILLILEYLLNPEVFFFTVDRSCGRPHISRLPSDQVE